MRGASALQPMLDALPDARIRTLVVWEPVIFTDLGPPTSSVLALVRDRRARQFWDPGRAVSQDIVRSVDADPRRYGFDAPLGSGYIVWDVALVFGPGAVWGADLPVPAFHDRPVAYHVDRLAAAIAQAASVASGGES